MNPTVGRERQWGQGTLTTVGKDATKKIIIVGGGPAGMKTAARLRFGMTLKRPVGAAARDGGR